MTSLAIFCVALFVSSTHALRPFFQPVEGKCSDLPTISEYDDRKVATGEWYGSHVSFGNEGDKCGSGHVIGRGTKNYVDILLFDSKNNHYLNMPADMTYHPDKPGMYKSDDGVTCQNVATDSQNYIFTVYCIEEDGQTQAMAHFATRDRKFHEKYEAIYNEASAELAKKKLLPKMHKIENTHCPPLDNVVQLSP